MWIFRKLTSDFSVNMSFFALNHRATTPFVVVVRFRVTGKKSQIIELPKTARNETSGNQHQTRIIQNPPNILKTSSQKICKLFIVKQEVI